MFCLPCLPPTNKSFKSSWLASNSLFLMLLWIIECFLLDLSFFSHSAASKLSVPRYRHLLPDLKAGNTLGKYYNTFLKGFSVFTPLHIISQ